MTRFSMILMAALVACGGNNAAPADDGAKTEAPTAKKDTSPAGVAKVAKAIKASPDKQGEILKSNGWTAAEFETALWEIAQDAAKSEAYRKALGA